MHAQLGAEVTMIPVPGITAPGAAGGVDLQSAASSERCGGIAALTLSALARLRKKLHLSTIKLLARQITQHALLRPLHFGCRTAQPN